MINGPSAANEYALPARSGTVGDVIEFLIRTGDGHDWPAIHRDRIPHVLTPAGWDCTQIPGWGDYRLRCGDTEIAFSGEPVGWEVTFEGPMPEQLATRLIITVAAQVEQETDQPIEWIQNSA